MSKDPQNKEIQGKIKNNENKIIIKKQIKKRGTNRTTRIIVIAEKCCTPRKLPQNYRTHSTAIELSCTRMVINWENYSTLRKSPQNYCTLGENYRARRKSQYIENNRVQTVTVEKISHIRTRTHTKRKMQENHNYTQACMK